MKMHLILNEQMQKFEMSDWKFEMKDSKEGSCMQTVPEQGRKGLKKEESRDPGKRS